MLNQFLKRDVGGINVWTQPWIPNRNRFRPVTNLMQGLEELCINEFFIPGCKEWDVEFLNEVF